MAGKAPDDLSSTIRGSIGDLRLMDLYQLRPSLGEHSYLNAVIIDAYLLYISKNYLNSASLTSGIITTFARNKRLPRTFNVPWISGFRGKIYIPLHMPELKHWGLLIADFSQKIFISMDSLNCDHKKVYSVSTIVANIRFSETNGSY